MLGAGLSKLGAHASTCWRDFTCMTTHYETQPNPNPIAWFMHKLPVPVHKIEVGVNHVTELVAVWLLLAPWPSARLGGALVQIAFQFAIIVTGNYAYINWITLVAFVSCLSDAFLLHFFSHETIKAAAQAECEALSSRNTHLNTHSRISWPSLRTAIEVLLLMFIGFKSVPPVREMFSEAPWLNYYDDFYFVNAYGVFGFINQHRYTTVLEFSHGNGTWNSLDLPCYPGRVDRMPCIVSPYHYRFDWDLWIHTTASLESSHGFPLWKYRGFVPIHLKQLIFKILDGDADTVMSLLDVPFDSLFRPHPPVAIHASLYLHHFSNFTDIFRGIWWQREKIPEAEYTFHTRARTHASVTRTLTPLRDHVMCCCAFGMFLSLFALFVKFRHAVDATAACPIGNGGSKQRNCGGALVGPHSSVILGIPNALLGFVFFVAVFLAAWQSVMLRAVCVLCVCSCVFCSYLASVLWRESEWCVVCVATYGVVGVVTGCVCLDALVVNV
eukprot:c9639_g1_i2.p1 GENE.c9639_g1_i2~~c9639_g1_i2.p1  ORF type:complete len:498 (+),score=126.59 c9639_g1_i2:496-1989(+)